MRSSSQASRAAAFGISGVNFEARLLGRTDRTGQRRECVKAKEFSRRLVAHGGLPSLVATPLTEVTLLKLTWPCVEEALLRIVPTFESPRVVRTGLRPEKV